MMDAVLGQRLQEREGKSLLRRLKTTEGMVDFSSNDYLGFARSEDLRRAILAEVQNGFWANGSGGSRLLAGNHSYTEEVEHFIANYHQTEAALIFNSGYDANVGLFSSVPQKGDTVISDELVHASIIDGIRLSHAHRYIFKHNDLESLEQKLRHAQGRTFIAVESVYSMDGDEAPLKEIVELAKRYEAYLIVDEAHATGLYGSNGCGKVEELNLEKEVFARVHTYGKALGTHGAAVLGSSILREYLINHARSFIYTTALPIHSIIGIKKAYDILSKNNRNKLIINNNINLFKSLIKDAPFLEVLESNSPIQSIIVPGNEAVRSLAQHLQAQGLDVRPIVSPTVPAGRERIRICLHTFNTEAEIRQLCTAVQSYYAA